MPIRVKGQLISKCPFSVMVSTKIPTKNFLGLFFLIIWKLFYQGLFWFDLFLEAGAEILKIFRWYIGRNDKGMKNIQLGHSLRFYVHKKVFSPKKKLGFSKAIGGLSPPYLAIDKFECSVHIYRDPWINSRAKHSLITGDSPETGIPACETCYCRPMWCLTCLGKWFAMRQDKNRPDTWLSSKCPCPTCRSKFCLLDVSLISWRKIYFISYCLK